MISNRETDILYLAHELWEGSDEPKASPQSYWKQAALDVLAQGQKSLQKVDHIGANRSRTQVFCRYQSLAKLDQSPAKLGKILYIEMRSSPEGRCVILSGRCNLSEAANTPEMLERLAD